MAAPPSDPAARGQTDSAGMRDQSPSTEEVDAIVVGSGFGGAVTACRLAQAGMKVLILERGRRYEADDFPALPDETTLLPDPRRWRWQGDQGLWDVLDLEEILTVQAAGYGGGSLIYANVHLRPPPKVFDSWPKEYRDGAALESFYDLAAHMLEVAPVNAYLPFAEALVKADQMKKAAGHIGREVFYPPLAIRYADGPNDHGTPQKACINCGNCCAGCRHRAKNTLDANYLAVAERHGARAMTQCEVTTVRELGQGEGFEVRCIDHLRAARVRHRAKYVFLCAGSVHSTRLLARAELRSEGARAAQRLAGIGYFPGADALGIAYDTAHDQFPSFGPTITTALVHWDEKRASSFFLVEDGGYGRQLERLTGLLRAPAWVGRNRLSRKGPGLVDSSSDKPPPFPPMEKSTGSGVRPPLDAVLDAISRGDLRGALGEDASRALSAFIAEIKDPLLVPAVVDATLERALRERQKHQWPFRYFAPDGWPLRCARRIAKKLARWALGDSSAIAGHALGAMLHAGDLDRAELAAQVLGLESKGANRRAVFLCMGRDAATGQLYYDPVRDRLVADLDLFDLAQGYASEELLMKQLAGALGGELRTNPLWAFLGKPITVHNQGGCPMSDRAGKGVTRSDGQVWGCEGLYVLDGSIFCGSVGANPSATIMALAERNVLAFIRAHRSSQWPDGYVTAGAEEYRKHRLGASAWADRARQEKWAIRPPIPPAKAVELEGRPLGISFRETMQGYYHPTHECPRLGLRGEGWYRDQETAGCPDHPIDLNLDVSVENLAAFFEDEQHVIRLGGSSSIAIWLPGTDRPPKHPYPVQGSLELLVASYKPHAIQDPDRLKAHQAFATRPYRATADAGAPTRERYMKYHLWFSDGGGQRWKLWGYKRIRRQAGSDAWRATSTLFCQLHGPLTGDPGNLGPATLSGVGAVHVDLASFLRKQLPSLHVTPESEDPARKAWALAKFGAFFFGNLQRIYMPELGSFLDSVLRAQIGDVQYHPR